MSLQRPSFEPGCPVNRVTTNVGAYPAGRRPVKAGSVKFRVQVSVSLSDTVLKSNQGIGRALLDVQRFFEAIAPFSALPWHQGFSESELNGSREHRYQCRKNSAR
jgi:hypothetical protein